MSFQKFIGVAGAKDTPDETTICRLRNELTKLGFQEMIFSITQSLLSELGFTVKEGHHIQDGTLIEAPKGKKNRYGENTRDKDATFTTASIHDSQQQNALMTGDETCGYGDSVYGMSEKNNEAYRDCGMQPEFHEKGKRSAPPDAAAERNQPDQIQRPGKSGTSLCLDQEPLPV